MDSRLSSAPKAAKTPLPNEVISLIIKHLTRDDLFQARHISKAFAAVAAPRLFETIPLWIGLRSLQILTELSEHPQLRQCVKKIVFSPLRFVDDEDEAMYLSRMKTTISLSTNSRSRYALLAIKHELAYRTFIEAQRRLTADGLDISILTHAFKQLPSFMDVDLDHANMLIGANLLRRELEFFDSSDILSLDSLYPLPVLFRALSTAKVWVERLKIRSSPTFSKAISRDATLVTRDNNGSRSTRQYPRPTTSEALVKALSTGDTYGYVRNALSRLRSLNIQDVGWDWDNEEATQQIRTIVRQMLSPIGSLECVMIGQIGSSEYEEQLSIEDLFYYYGQWALVRLDLSGLTTTQHILVGFLRGQGSTLESIEFWGITLTDTTWSATLANLRLCGFLALKTFILKECYDLETQHGYFVWPMAVLDYVLRKVDRNPYRRA